MSWQKVYTPDTGVTHAVSMVTVGLKLHYNGTLKHNTNHFYCLWSLYIVYSLRSQGKVLQEFNSVGKKKSTGSKCYVEIKGAMKPWGASENKKDVSLILIVFLPCVYDLTGAEKWCQEKLSSPFQLCSGLQQTWWLLWHTRRPSHPPTRKCNRK